MNEQDWEDMLETYWYDDNYLSNLVPAMEWGLFVDEEGHEWVVST